MTNNKVVLLIEDEKNINNFMKASLKTQGYDVISARTGGEGLAMALSYNPDLILLDLGLPDIDGIELIKNIRQLMKNPIIVVSARENDREKVKALDLGAEDYITKPFSIAELLARVRVVFRRLDVLDFDKENEEQVYNFGELTVDVESREVKVNDELVHLTPIEYKILILFIKYSGKVLTHNFIIKEIWGGVMGNETQSLRVFVASLRRKIKGNGENSIRIVTEVGVGYRFISK